MDWLLASPKIQSAFASLGCIDGDSYIVSPNALTILEEINCKLTYEDQTLRTYRRAIGFGQNIRTDLIPLLVNATDNDVVSSVIRILVNLTVPVECLFSVDVMNRTEAGRTTIFELNNLLHKSKEAFTDPKSTKSVLEFMKHILDSDPKMSPEKCGQITNCLILLRNILHIPDINPNRISSKVLESSGSKTNMQNTILWNLFGQNMDKMLLYLMTCPRRSAWIVTMAQLIALMYREQHVITMQKILNMWYENSLSESSEDNESNTTPLMQQSGDSSPMLTSDPTSDASDNGSECKKESPEDRRQSLREEIDATLQEVSRKGHEYQNALIRVPTEQQMQNQSSEPNLTDESNNQQVEAAKPTPSTAMDVTTYDDESQQTFKLPSQKSLSVPHYNTCGKTKVRHSSQVDLTKGKSCPTKRQCASSSDQSDYGYDTHVENQELVSIFTSSNEEYSPQDKPVPNQKPRTKHRAILSLLDNKDIRRKKLHKRSKSSLFNLKGLSHYIPSSEDITNLLKEFTVDFLLKAYDFVVRDLHMQLLKEAIFSDTSHFFWLLTYFMKFAAQLEVDLEHMRSVLTFNVISFLAYEGVNLCEQLELNKRQESSDFNSYLRRMHLLVTAIREFLQAIETYKKIIHLSEVDRTNLHRLQVQISSSEDIRNLFLLLIRSFDPIVHTKQYLQDLIITNHMLLQMIDSVTKSDPNTINTKMINHISQFATIEVMSNYGLLLENFTTNGEFVNDCIFTMMHHVIGGGLGHVAIMFQPVILKTFTTIWENDYEVCEDWGDLIEYIINRFTKTSTENTLNLRNESLTEIIKEHNYENTECTWTQEEMNTIYWYYVQGKKAKDVVGNIVQLFSENGKKPKSRLEVVQQLLQQDIISLVEFDDLMKFEDSEYQKSLSLLMTPTSTSEESGIGLKESYSDKPADDFQVLRDLIIKERKLGLLTWLQNVLLECCYIKLVLQKYKKQDDRDKLPNIMEPIAYHCIYRNESIPIVQWNLEQKNTMLYQPFVLLLHKLGFQLPADAGSIYARIPSFWTAEMMFSLAKKLGPLDSLVIKFDINLIKESAVGSEQLRRSSLTVIHENKRIYKNHTPMSDDESGGRQFERTGLRDISSYPRPNQANSIIRFTSPAPSVPNWLQIVMRSKCIPSDRSNMGFTLPNNVFVSSVTNDAPSMVPPSFPYNGKLVNLDGNNHLSQEEMQQKEQDQYEEHLQITDLDQLEKTRNKKELTSLDSFSDDDDSATIDESVMKSIQRNYSISSGFHTQRGSETLEMDTEFFAMVTSAVMNEQSNTKIDSQRLLLQIK